MFFFCTHFTVFSYLTSRLRCCMYLEVCLLKRIAYVSLLRFGPIVVNLASLQPLPFLVYYGIKVFLKFSLFTEQCSVLGWLTTGFNELCKGQLRSKGLLGFFNSSKKQTKNFCPSRLGPKLKFSSSSIERIEDLSRLIGL